MDHDGVPWQDLVSQGVREFQRFAMVGNTADAIRTLERIDEIVRAAVERTHLPETTLLDINSLRTKVHPDIVLRQERRATAIITAALRHAGVLPRELSHVTYYGSSAA